MLLHPEQSCKTESEPLGTHRHTQLGPLTRLSRITRGHARTANRMYKCRRIMGANLSPRKRTEKSEVL